MLANLIDSQKSIQKFRTRFENVYFYIIKDFMLLSEFEQEHCFKTMYAIYLSAIRGLSYEEFKLNLINRKGENKSCLFIIEKMYKTIVGFQFYVIEEFFYKENNFSKENTYMCCLDLGALLPHFMGGGILKKAYKLTRTLFHTSAQGLNLISFQRVANPLIYEMLSSNGNLVYPGPKKYNYPEIDKMLKKLMIHYDSEGGTKAKPFVITRKFNLMANYKEVFRKMYSKSSKHFKFFVDQTGLEDNTLLVCLSIELLAEGNTLEVPAYEFTSASQDEYDYRFYNPLLSSLYKL